jgi:hypothetical protein
MTIKSMVFKIGDKLIKKINEFKYLGRMLEQNDSDWPAVKHIRHDPNDPDGTTWICSSSEGVLEEAGLAPIEEYIKQRKATIQGYVTS